MRSFTAILATLSLPLFAFAAHHGHSARHDGDVALRARGDLLPKRNFQGRLTWYDISLYKVTCGGQYSSNDFVIALNRPQFDSPPGSLQYCGQTVTITYGGNSVSAIIVDECLGCDYGGIDCSEAVFKALASLLEIGVIFGTWEFGNGGGSSSSSSPPPEGQPTTSTPTYTTHLSPYTTYPSPYPTHPPPSLNHSLVVTSTVA